MPRLRLLVVTLAVIVGLAVAGAPRAYAGSSKSTWRAASRTRTVTDIVSIAMPDTVLANQTVSVTMSSSVTDTPTACDQPDTQPAPPSESVSMPGQVQFLLNGVVKGAASMSTALKGTRTYNTSCHLGSQYAATEALTGSGSLTMPALSPGTYDVLALSTHDADGIAPSLVSRSGTVVVSAPATTTTTTTTTTTSPSTTPTTTATAPPPVTATSTVSVPGGSTTSVVTGPTTTAATDSSTTTTAPAAGAPAPATTSSTTIASGDAVAVPVDYVPTASDRTAGGRSGLALLGLVTLVGLLLLGTTTRTLGREAAAELATSLIADAADASWSLLDVDPVSKPDDDSP